MHAPQRMLALSAAALWLGASLGAACRPCDRPAAIAVGALLLWLLERRRFPAPLPLVFLAAGLALGVPPARRVPPAAREVRGRLAGIERTARGTELVFSTSERISVPRLGDPDLDRLPAGALPGARVRVPLRPSRPETGVRRAVAARRVRVLDPPSGPWHLLALRQRCRARLAERVAQSFPVRSSGGAAGLARAVVGGLRRDLDEESWRRLRESGLAHLAVVSGLHVGAVSFGLAVLVCPLSGRRNPRRRLVALIGALALLAFLPSSSPVLRASTMVLLARGATLGGRAAPPLSALGTACVALLALWPGLARSASFGLTVAATAAIVLAAEGPARGRAMRILVAPWVATWPILVELTGRCSPWSVPAQVLAGPALAPALAGGWAAVLCGDGALAHRGAALSLLACRWILLVARLASRLPGSGRLAGAGGTIWLAALEVSLAGWLLARRRRPRGFLLSSSIALAAIPLLAPGSSGGTETAATIFDVGHGQAVLIEAGGHRVLIDTGPGGPRARRLVHRLRARGIRHVDLVVLSHRDADHVGAARTLLAVLAPDALAASAALVGEAGTVSLFGEAASRGVPVRLVARGRTLRIGPIRLEVLHPPDGARDPGNDGSLVTRVELPGLSVLVPADAGLGVERELIARGLAGRPVDVLVAAHHGAASATGESLLAALRPRLVVASCGPRSLFGHPAPETVRRIREAGARLLTTAGSGSLRVEASGSGRRRLLLRDY